MRARILFVLITSGPLTAYTCRIWEKYVGYFSWTTSFNPLDNPTREMLLLCTFCSEGTESRDGKDLVVHRAGLEPLLKESGLFHFTTQGSVPGTPDWIFLLFYFLFWNNFNWPKSYNTSTKNSCILFTQVHQMWAFCHICFNILSSPSLCFSMFIPIFLFWMILEWIADIIHLCP